MGFKTKWLSYENIERVAGRDQVSFWKLFKYSIEGILAFTIAPLALALICGVLLTVAGVALAIGLGVYACAKRRGLFSAGRIVQPHNVCGGLQLIAIGIVGQYLGRLYLEGKHRPVYILRETEQGLCE